MCAYSLPAKYKISLVIGGLLIYGGYRMFCRFKYAINHFTISFSYTVNAMLVTKAKKFANY